MALVLYLKSPCPTKGHLGFLLCHLLEFLQFCILLLSSVIHFELIFLKGVSSHPSRSVSRFIIIVVIVIFCRWISKWSQHYLFVKRTFFHCIAFTNLSKISSLYLHGSISGISVCSIDHYCQLTVPSQEVLKSGASSLTLFSSFNVVLATLDLLPLHISFGINLFITMK